MPIGISCSATSASSKNLLQVCGEILIYFDWLHPLRNQFIEKVATATDVVLPGLRVDSVEGSIFCSGKMRFLCA